MVAIGTQSLQNIDNVFPGFWSHVHIVEDPDGPGETEFYLGQVDDGVLRLTREDAELLGTTFPRAVEHIFPTRAGMSFAGQMLEPHKRNLHFLLRDLPSTSSAYLYPGVSCGMEDTYVNFCIRRDKCSNNFVMEALFYKALAAGAFELGFNAEGPMRVPFEVNALNDINGDFGGSIDRPLGYILADDVHA